MVGLIRRLLVRFTGSPTPVHIQHRYNKTDAAIVFVHGFGGDIERTWGQFPHFLCSEKRLEKWDVHSLGYPSSLRVDVPGVWSADPALKTLAIALRTRLSLEPLSRYEAIAVAAHSMGGLIVQRAILDDHKLANRISHAIFFGTPSGGLAKANLFGLVKRQFRDMASGSPFVTDLRNAWNSKYLTNMPFELRVVAGERDEFVPISSSLEPFPDLVQWVIPGNHLEIVKPSQREELSVTLVVDALAGRHHVRSAVDGARLAVERRQFQKAIDVLLPRAAELDDAALVMLVMALDGMGRGPEGLAILEQRYRGGISSTDALGVLGGRLKRRWLAERSQMDLARARDTYRGALSIAEAKQNYAQAYYHAINVAFLDLMSSAADSVVPQTVLDMAQRARMHCLSSPENSWRVATEAEAELILGHLDQAIELYSRAISMTHSPREIDSMYSQAIRVAARMHGETGARRIEEAFGVPGA